MNEISWWSQQYAPEGSVAGDGIVKQLGRPSLDPLTILVREAAQNSWDARAGSGPVRFQVDLTRLGSTSAAWRRLLLPGPVPNARVRLEDYLNDDAVLLTVSDRNTVGLGGPLRAGTRPDEGEKPDFVQFLRNVGEPRDHEHGGGTYGFGKGIFYRLSRAGAILVDTLAAGAEPKRRLMGAALGDSYYVDDQRYTGRHWWGLIDDGVPDPLIGDRADDLRAELALPDFADGFTGTDIVIIAADLGSVDANVEGPERTIDQAAQYLASSILWHLWPKFLPDENGRWMEFAVTVDGDEIQMPAPADLDELLPFVEALAEVRGGGGSRYARTVHPKNAGSLALKVSVAEPPRYDAPYNVACPFTGPLHHIARMRTPELVVDYQAGMSHPDARLAYAGVFRASPEADEAFAAAEPPTHDAWISKGLSGSTKGVVQRVQGFISGQIEQTIGTSHSGRGGEGAGLGDLSARLATLIPAPSDTTVSSNAIGADGRKRAATTGRGGAAAEAGSRRGAWKPRVTESPRLRLVDGVPRVVARVRVPAADTPRNVQAEVNVVLEGGGTESDPPAGAGVPTIIEWRSAESGDASPGDLLTLPPGDASDWWLHATHVEDAVIRLKVSAGSRHGQ